MAITHDTNETIGIKTTTIPNLRCVIKVVYIVVQSTVFYKVGVQS